MTEQKRRELGWCEEAQTYCSCNEEAYKKGRVDTIEEIAEIISKVHIDCADECPVPHCLWNFNNWGDHGSCKEVWKDYLMEKIKGEEE